MTLALRLNCATVRAVEGRLLIKNCTLQHAGELRHRQAVVIEGAVITGIHDDARVPVLPGDWEIAAQERLLLTGRARSSTKFSEVLRGSSSGASAEAVARWVCAQHLLNGFTTVTEQLPPGVSAEQFDTIARALGLQIGSPAAAAGAELSVGQEANLILVDAVVPQVESLTVLTTDAPVSWVITEGLVRVRERHLLAVDAIALAQQCAAVLRAP